MSSSSSGPAPRRSDTASLARSLVRALLEPRNGSASAAGAPTLVGLSGPAAGRRYLLVDEARADRHRWTLGRAATCDIVLIDPDLSRHHVQFERATDGWFIADLGSKNGTRIDGVALPRGARQHLRDGACVQLGGCTLHFEHRVARYAQQLETGGLGGDSPFHGARKSPLGGASRSSTVGGEAAIGRPPSVAFRPAQVLAGIIAGLAAAGLAGLLL